MNESQQHREEQKKFSSAQWTFFINSMIVYAGIYVVRNNLSMAQPGMLEEGVISTYALGTILTIYGVLYGVGQFVNSFWADRFNGRIFMTIGLAISALANFFFGCSSLTIFFAIFWLINGWGVSMGFPASTNMLTHWIHPKELATKMSIWTTSNNFGKVMVLGLCSLILGPLGLNWRWCFWVPGALVALIAAFCFFFVKASPTEAGVHELEVEEEVIHKPSSEITTADRCRLVFGNRTIWLVSIASIFVAVVSDIFLCWGPTFLKQLKGIPVSTSGWIMIAFQIAAIFGSIFAGWLTDNVFKGRGVRTCVIYMCCAALFTYGFWALPNDGTELQFAYNSVNAPKTENVRAVLRDFDKNIIVKHKPQENQLIIHTLYLNNSEDKKIEDFDDIDAFVTSKLQQKFAAFNFTLTSSKETASMSILMATLVLMLIGFFIQGTYGLLGRYRV